MFDKTKIDHLKKYPVIFRDKKYTVTIRERYGDDFLYDNYEVKVFPGKRSIFPIYKEPFLIIKRNSPDFISMVNQTMHDYVAKVLKSESELIAAKKVFDEWDGIVEEFK